MLYLNDLIKRVPDEIIFGKVNMSSKIDKKILDFEMSKLETFSEQNLKSNFIFRPLFELI